MRDLDLGVTPLGRGGFLSSLRCSHFTLTAVYLYSAVMFGISLEAGAPAIVFLPNAVGTSVSASAGSVFLISLIYC